MVILAGPWPKAPSPTLLPGGEGSYSPTYEVPSEGKHTFYYLELQLESKLSKQLHELSDIVDRNGGGLRYHWSGVREIKAPEDRDFWREQFLPRHVQQQRRFEGDSGTYNGNSSTLKVNFFKQVYLPVPSHRRTVAMPDRARFSPRGYSSCRTQI